MFPNQKRLLARGSVIVRGGPDDRRRQRWIAWLGELVLFTASCSAIAVAADNATGPRGRPAAPPSNVPAQPDTAKEQWERHLLREQQERLPVPVFAKVLLPHAARITLFSPAATPHRFAAPAIFGMRSRHRYAFVLDQLEDAPGKNFYGTIEVLRGLRLPKDKKGSEVPVPVRFSDEDISRLARGHMITKIMVLENAETALAEPSSADEPVRYEAALGTDPVAMAKSLGKPILVVRVGNREPEASELAVASARSLLVPRQIRTFDSNGDEHVLPTYFVYADEASSANGMDRRIDPAGYSHPPKAVRASQRGAMCDPASRACEAFPVMRGEVQPGPGSVPVGSTMRALPEDEYVCDGGDEAMRVGVNPHGQIVNLDSGDTVIDYRDLLNRRRFLATNEVCVFAPRFVEVDTVAGIEGLEGYAIVHHLERDRNDDVLMQLASDSDVVRYDRLIAVQTRQRPSGYVTDEGPSAFTEVRSIEGYEGGIGYAVTLEANAVRRLTGEQQAALAKQTQLARRLSQVDSPQIVGVALGTSELNMAQSVFQVFAFQDRRHKPARVTITKRATVSVANIGDVIEFVIDFANVGEENVSHVAVIDNLPTRLEYVKESAQSSVDAVFSAQENDIGSHTLRWELKGVLKGGERGSVRFKARVR